MQEIHRIFTIVIDSMGIGSAPDSAEYGDEGANTLGHIQESMPEPLSIPALKSLGLGALCPAAGGESFFKGYAMRMQEVSAGKDTMTGHWELMGLRTQTPFRTFTDNGFPQALIDELEQRTGHRIVGNCASSGTAILDEWGEHEIATGDMIVYTSADSVLQICGNEETFGLEELYRCCRIARELTMREEWKVGRVIARPYVGRKAGEFRRTSNRHDYALKPFGPTALTVLKEHAYDVISIGKIKDIFDGEGITEAYASKSSVHGMDQTLEMADRDWNGLCFVNLVDFDALWGHRRDPLGYGRELEAFDQKLEQLLQKLRPGDLLLITADHGNDPTWHGTDHTREYVPLLAYSPSMEKSGMLPDQRSFGTVGATILEAFGLTLPEGAVGSSVWGVLK